ncbi:MAG: hypothetical protein FK731_08790, partial [Asgard group archaeon]|nr:hypothetical protein [Asgard group archaeon]
MRIKSIFNKKSEIIILFTLLMLIMIADSPATFNTIEKIPLSEEILTLQKVQSPIQDNLNFETDYEMIASYGWDLPE